MTKITIKGARTHNLKNVSLEIPKKRIVVFTGVSGSGKSSLVFDTIYTEAQRQLVETFSSFARSRMPKLSKPDVDEIRNISTAIVIDQKRMGVTLRSTVGTATELYTYLRLLFSRCGDTPLGPSFVFGFNHPSGMCEQCKGLGKRIRVDVDKLIDKEKTIREGAVNHPDYKVGGWTWRELVSIDLFDVDKKLKDFTAKELGDFLYARAIPVQKKHGVGTYTKNFEGVVSKLERLHINKAQDNLSEARRNAYTKYFIYSDCDACGGTRINEKARKVRLNGKTIPELVSMELTELTAFLGTVEGEIARPMVQKMQQILSYLIDIGVGYLSLNRAVATLSGGESQRVKMARQLDCDLVDLMYILDEPSIGLHPKDINKLIGLLKKLRDKGNSVFVVEHDPSVIMSADHVVDIGPQAGSLGGEVVFTGTPEELAKSDGLTGRFLRSKTKTREKRRAWTGCIEIRNAALHNLRNVSTKIPKGVLTCITGVAGSGKSSLINGTFLKEHPDAVVVDQSPVGKSSRSNPATYIGVFDAIRKEFSESTGKPASLFSFNSSGACPKCNGLGEIHVEMSFLDEVKIVCDECGGKRYTKEVLALHHKGRNIHDVLSMTILEAKDFFDDPETRRKLAVYCDVGLEYLRIGQPLSTLSGGEAQRIKLASELHKKGKIYVMDEPTTGLHLADTEKLMRMINSLVDNTNTVVVIEHNLDVIKHADWIIDMGPEGGKKGGTILFEGTPEALIKCQNSYTGQYLKKTLG
ncbi:MAG: excinuclease ABC subunit UvrA [Candidatus ainarchaeum sp.]|nr:excinuclease ABC subunit UvrA [Candidatus ainarchaeum sp.]